MLRTAALVALSLAAACTRATDAPPTPRVAPTAVAPTAVAPTPVPLGEPRLPQMLESLGYTIDVPESWHLRPVGPDAYTFRIPSVKQGAVTVIPRLDITRTPSGPATVDVAARRCAGEVGARQLLDGGAFYYTCEQRAGGITIRDFRLVIPGESYISCDGSGIDLSATLAACLSLRKG